MPDQEDFTGEFSETLKGQQYHITQTFLNSRREWKTSQLFSEATITLISKSDTDITKKEHNTQFLI